MRALILLAAVVGALPNREPRSLDCDIHSNVTSQAAVQLVNTRHPHGYKFQLRETHSSHEVEKGQSGCEYELELALEETQCHVINPKPFEECKFREMGEMKVTANCNVTLSYNEGKAKLKKYSCNTAPDSAEELVAVCPDCPTLLPLRDPHGLDSIKQALKKFHQESNDTALFKLLEVGRFSTQYMMLGQSYFAEFAIVETGCSRETAPESQDACRPLCHDQARHGFCSSTLLGNGEVMVECEIYHVQNETDEGPRRHHQHHHHRPAGPKGEPCGPPGFPGQHTRPAPGPPQAPPQRQPPFFPRPFPPCSGQREMYPSIYPICPPPPSGNPPPGPPPHAQLPDKPGMPHGDPPPGHARGPPFQA